MEKNNAKISFDAALQMALYAQMERELETMPSTKESMRLSKNRNTKNAEEKPQWQFCWC